MGFAATLLSGVRRITRRQPVIHPACTARRPGRCQNPIKAHQTHGRCGARPLLRGTRHRPQPCLVSLSACLSACLCLHTLLCPCLCVCVPCRTPHPSISSLVSAASAAVATGTLAGLGAGLLNAFNGPKDFPGAETQSPPRTPPRRLPHRATPPALILRAHALKLETSQAAMFTARPPAQPYPAFADCFLTTVFTCLSAADRPTVHLSSCTCLNPSYPSVRITCYTALYSAPEHGFVCKPTGTRRR